MVLIKNEQAVIKRYENQDEVPTISFDMNVARIGDAAFASNPAAGPAVSAEPAAGPGWNKSWRAFPPPRTASSPGTRRR